MVGMNMETSATGPALSCRLVPSRPYTSGGTSDV